MTTESSPADSRVEELLSRLIKLQEAANKQLRQIKRRLPAGDVETDEDNDED